MSVLRVYDPSECDERGVPLDWERCRHRTDDGCSVCRPGGCAGSLKAAVLASRLMRFRGSVPIENPRHRCEDCGHPMSDGTWEYERWPEGMGRDGGAMHPVKAGVPEIALDELRHGREPKTYGVHYSPCDEGCGHTGYDTVRRATAMAVFDPTVWRMLASWRSVDVRTLGWPHDLRPERLAVLCLRCWAARQ